MDSNCWLAECNGGEELGQKLVQQQFNNQMWFLPLQTNTSVIKAETALMYDAVHLFAKALHDLDTSQQINIQPLSCDGQDTWPHGYSLINYMKIVSRE